MKDTCRWCGKAARSHCEWCDQSVCLKCSIKIQGKGKPDEYGEPTVRLICRQDCHL